MTLHGLQPFLLITSHVRNRRRGPLARVHPWTQFPTFPIMGVSFYCVSGAGAEMLDSSSDMSYLFVHDSDTLSLPKLTCPNSLSKFRICDIFNLRQVNNFLQVYSKKTTKRTTHANSFLSYNSIIIIIIITYTEWNKASTRMTQLLLVFF